MVVHRQRCQACGSLEHNVLLVRDPGRAQVALLRCAKCRNLVARYELSAYYHHGRGYESWIGSFKGVAESGRDMLSHFDEVKAHAEADFDRALERLHLDGKD